MQQAFEPVVSLILGGVRSGKSRHALRLAGGASRVTFVATGKAVDGEMRDRIERHQAERPSNWITREEPIELAQALRDVDSRCEYVIVDCLSFYAANLMELCGGDSRQVHGHLDELCGALLRVPCPTVLVSNEVGSGVVPAYPAGRQYRDLLGEINQRVAAVASDVVLMIAGLPLALKQGGRPVERIFAPSAAELAP